MILRRSCQRRVFAEGSDQWKIGCFPFTIEVLGEFGLPVKTDLPVEVYELMDLYPQVPGQRPSVQYVPIPYRDPGSRESSPGSSPAGSRPR